MANINLSQSNLERSNQDLGTVFDKSLVISLGLLILSFGTLFGLKMYNSYLEKKTAMLSEEILAQLKVLEGDSVNRVIDFQERLTNIDRKLTSKDISPVDMFASMEKLMVSEASLDTYEYDVAGKTLSLKIVTGDFKIIARQVMNFKSFGAFKSVAVTDTLKKDDGTVVSNVIISL